MSQSPKKGQSANVSQVASSTSDTALVSAGTGSNGRLIFNDSTAILYLKFGTGASSSSHSLQVVPAGMYQALGDSSYAGVINGAWAAANGNARITTW